MSVLFSRGCEYALRGLVEMARRPEKPFWTVQELAKLSETPAPFLAKTFQILVKHGILSSTKGRRGGFSFARPLQDISLMDVVGIIDGPTLANECALGFDECSEKNPCPIHFQWRDIREQIVRALSAESLLEFARESKPKRRKGTIKAPRTKNR